MKYNYLLLSTLVAMQLPLAAQETFQPYKTAKDVPSSATELWNSYDPRKEALDVEVHKEWKADGIVTRLVTFTVGTFKGKKSRLAAYYCFPEGATKAPAFVWSHGGGQRAERRRAEYFAKQGYAVLDINWNGRALDPHVKANTDWGNIDPSQGKRFYPMALRKKFKALLDTDEHSIDLVTSPRNSNWFLLAVAARRSITFLEQQAEVNSNRIGFAGYSMGGTITSMVAPDSRLKAVAPFVGGTANLHIPFPGGLQGTTKPYVELDLYERTLDPGAHWSDTKCPVMFITSSNDFHATFERIFESTQLLPHNNWRVSSKMHNNHGPGPEQWATLNLWFDQHLKDKPATIPDIPFSSFSTHKQTATFKVTPKQQDKLHSVQLFYSHDPNSRARFWKQAKATQVNGTWSTTLVLQEDLPLYVFAQCKYNLNQPITLERGQTHTFSITSQEHVFMPVKVNLEHGYAKLEKTTLVDDFSDGLINWDTSRNGALSTYKFQDPSLHKTKSQELTLTFNLEKGKKYNLLLDADSKYLSAEKYIGNFKFKQIIEGDGETEIRVNLNQFKGEHQQQFDWSRIVQFRLIVIDLETKSKISIPQKKGFLQHIELKDSKLQ